MTDAAAEARRNDPAVYFKTVPPQELMPKTSSDIISGYRPPLSGFN